MATNDYRKNYKRKWISACRLLTKHVNNHANRLSTDLCKQPSAKISKIDMQQDDGLVVNELYEDINSNYHSGDSDCNNDCMSLTSNDACLKEVDSDCETSDQCLPDQLAYWVNQFQVKQNAVDGLLKILRQSGYPELPATARSLLNTARVVKIDNKSGMEYIYFPLADTLLKNFHDYPSSLRESVDYLDLSLNVDGLPLFKSSRGTLWPVLCGIMNISPVKIFPVALTYGQSKPVNLDFLSDTVKDLNTILKHGLLDGEKVIKVTLRCVVCDAPAKAFVKSSKLYSGYYGCDKCSQRGVWLGRMTYPEVENVVLRTNASFRAQSNEEHHHSDSPFCNLEFDMIKGFSIDYMHQLCLGVMKKLILAWMRGKKDVRISAQHVDQISAKLIRLKQFIPSCFARKPRGLAEVDRWKATEFRQFLLYTGKIVLKGILPSQFYEHFMVLSVASSILVSSELAKIHLKYASDLLKYFVEKAGQLYGSEFVIYNVHSLIHLADDVLTHGCLDRFSGFPFENYLQKLKRFVRSGKSPLVQIVRRLSESSGDVCQLASSSMVCVKPPNNGYILENSSCCTVIDERLEPQCEERMVSCRIYDQSDPKFLEPCDSRIIGVHKVNDRNSHIKLLPASSLKKQAIVVQLEQNSLLFLAILHQL